LRTVSSSRPSICARSSAEETGADALAREVRQLALDRLAEDLHQVLDLALGPRPVLGREGVDDQRLDAEVDGRLDGPAQGTRPGAMAFCDRQALALRPAPVAVHDDRDGTSPVVALRLAHY
jgi:hypothetical protein